jgi:chemotaxis protein CheD
MKIIVGVADMGMAHHSTDVIVTHGLGSCLAVTICDPVAPVGGLLHVMMPTAAANAEKAAANPYLYVDSGMTAFVSAMLKAGAVRHRWTLTVAGGATINGNDYFETGKRNYIMLKKVLWKAGMLIHAEDVGGNAARTVHMEVGTGRVWLTKDGADCGLYPPARASKQLQEA